MGVMGRWIQISGLILILTLGISHSALAEEESRLPEIFDVLKTIEQNLKEGNYGTASADLDYLNGIFKEQRSTWLLGCFVKKYQKWVRAGKGTEETVGVAALGGGTTITQTYSRGADGVEAKLVISPLASGLGAILNNPAFRGGANTKQKRLRNGLTVNVRPNEVSGTSGGASLSWKVTKSEVSENDLLAVASGSVNPGCVKEIVSGQ